MNEVIADNIRKRMAKKNMTQMQLASSSGVAQTTISLYLSPDRRKRSASGKVPSAKIAEVAAIAKGLECTITDLLSEEDQATPPIDWYTVANGLARDWSRPEERDLVCHFLESVTAEVARQKQFAMEREKLRTPQKSEGVTP